MIWSLLRLHKKKLVLHFSGDQLSQTLSSAPMQPESGSLLQIESSLPDRAAKQLSTTLQAISAALSHSECRLDFCYNARCRSCLSVGEQGLLERLELVIVSSSLENTTNTSFITLHQFQEMPLFLLWRAAPSWTTGNTIPMRATAQQLYEHWFNGLCGQWKIVLAEQG